MALVTRCCFSNKVSTYVQNLNNILSTFSEKARGIFRYDNWLCSLLKVLKIGQEKIKVIKAISSENVRSRFIIFFQALSHGCLVKIFCFAKQLKIALKFDLFHSFF